MTQTQATPSADTPPLEIPPSTTVEKAVDKLTVRLAPGADVSGTDALGLLLATRDLLLEALPEDASGRVARFLRRDDELADPEGSKAREAARLRADAASYERQARAAKVRAAEFDNLTPDEYVLALQVKRAEAAKDREDRHRRRQNTVTVHDIDGHIEVAVEDLEDAGWHKDGACPASTGPVFLAGANHYAPGDVAASAIHRTLQDWHDTQHGLTSWANCSYEPCRLLPESFKTFH